MLYEVITDVFTRKVNIVLVIPAVDMKNKKCVQLIQGNPDKKHVELDNPPEIAKKWVSEGAEMLHLVDLDGALDGKRVNDEFIEEIIRTYGVPVQIGGGIRSIEDAVYLVA